MLFAAAAIAANLPREPQADAKSTARKSSQEQAHSLATAGARANERKIPCKTPENASLCYWTHGRLSVYNGNPTYRIWKVGTRRILGVFNGPAHFPPKTDADNENPEFPPELDRAYELDNRRHKTVTGYMWTVTPDTFADFEVCPLEPERKGEMQAVCIESACRIQIDKDY